MAEAGLKEIQGQLKTRMDKAVEDFRKEMAATRTGRASVHMLDSVTVDYYGSQMPLNQIAGVHAEAQLITVQPFDPSVLPTIEKVIRTSDLGFNPMNDGKVIRIPYRHSPKTGARIWSSTSTKYLKNIALPFATSGVMATKPSRN
jgi:ribosome recycling factor